jgi:hypothetical protein
MPAFKMQLQGFQPAFADATVKVTNIATGVAVERKPFLDGTLLLSDLAAGQYEMEVKHPNLVLPIAKRKIKLFPQVPPTFVPIPIDPVLFKDSPIRDVPDADLGPIQQTATAVQQRIARVGGKIAGEAIKSADWNDLAQSVADLAGAILDLTKRVSPVGHDHPEIAEKIDEVEDNVRRFNESFGKSLLALQRKREAENLGRAADDAFGAIPANITKKVFDKIAELHPVAQSDPRIFSKRLALTGDTILTAINEAASAAQDANAFLAKPEVKALQAAASNYVDTGVTDAPDREMQVYQRNLALWSS